VFVDNAGDIYIADTLCHRIRRIDASTGILTTVAGNGTLGPLGDGGLATSAELSSPSAVLVDSVGNVFISDTDNHRVRRVDASTGFISTFAGTGTPNYNGDDVIATLAELSRPRGLALDSAGNLYIADENNRRVRRVDAMTGVITTVAGTGLSGGPNDEGVPATSANLSFPTDVAVDTSGDLFISVKYDLLIRRVDASTGEINTIAGSGPSGFAGDGGPATSAVLNLPESVAIDALGNVFLADTANNYIRRVDALTGTITTVAGAVDGAGLGPIAQARLTTPLAIARTPESTLFAGGASGTVQAARDDSAALEAVAGRYPHSIATGTVARFQSSSFGTVAGVAHNAADDLIYLTEATNNRVHVVTRVDPTDPDTWTIEVLAGDIAAGFADGAALSARFRNPTGLHFDDTAQVLYVADTGNHVIRAIDVSSGVAAATVSTFAGTPENLGFFGDGGAAGDALLYQPQALTRCPNGDFFVADTGNNRVRRIDSSGTISTVLGDGVAGSSGQGFPASAFSVNAPLGLACDSFGNLFVSSTTTVRMLAADDNGVVDGTGSVQSIFGAAPRDTFPASVSNCLTGVLVVDSETVQVTDSCNGMLIELWRQPIP
jgi:sugar lactone lactonase YvrE